jgi:AAA-like domain
LLGRIGLQLQLEDEIERFWRNHLRLSPLQRWMNAITDVVLPHYPNRLVIFVDEIDAVRSLAFSSDEFFAGIREFYNRRAQEPELERLTFCLLGVATPTDLIRDTRTTPFNIGHRIELDDFTNTEAAPLAQEKLWLCFPGNFVVSLFAAGQHFILRRRVPQPHCAIAASRGQPLAVG